jgi:hypothetical protein
LTGVGFGTIAHVSGWALAGGRVVREANDRISRTRRMVVGRPRLLLRVNS